MKDKDPNDNQGDLFSPQDDDQNRFNGSHYNPDFDDARLKGQLLRIYTVMKDGEWRTLPEISSLAKAPEASVSAQLRHLRKPKYGRQTINLRSRGDRSHGLFEYQLILNQRKAA